jgi:purine-nucleoside phosphorylase
VTRLGELVRAAAEFIQTEDPRQPEVGIILGSGLSRVNELLEDSRSIPYSSIPGFPRTSVAGHAGQLNLGRIGKKHVAIMSGRVHFYEGQSLNRVTLPVRVLQAIGCSTLIVTNAAGGINPEFVAGDVMLIEDHINLVGLGGFNPLRGLRNDELGVRFLNLHEAYDSALGELACSGAKQLGFELKRGVYVMVAGPSYETPAEIRFLRTIGGDAVGMSTASEVIVARQVGLRVLGLSCIANMALGHEHSVLTHQVVLAGIESAADHVTALIKEVLEGLQ